MKDYIALVTVELHKFARQPPSTASDWVTPGGTMNSLDVGGSCIGGGVAVSGSDLVPLNLVVSVPASVALGAHTLTVTASDASLVQTATFPFYIADYSGSLSASSLTMAVVCRADLFFDAVQRADPLQRFARYRRTVRF